MRKGLKKWMVAAMAAVTALAVCIPAYADTEKISNVKLTLSWDGEPLAGEDIGSISASVPESAHYTVTECYYRNEGDDIWERGTTPVVRVELEAKDGYRFSSLSKSKISISGCHGEYKSSKTLDSGGGYQIDIKLRKVSGDLTDIDENYWDGRTAVWTEVDDADKYEVKLYRGSRTVTTVTTTSNRYNFYPNMTSAGDYSFKVRAISNSDGEKSAWTDVSDDYYMNSSDVYKGGGNGGSTVNNGSAGWNQNQYGWYYVESNGNVVKNNWVFVDNNWFYLDGNGYMMTGWIFVDNNWFYLNPVSDGTRGAMMTGWQNIGGYWYYMNPVSDGTRGARWTSYRLIDGNWYFFDLNSGAMWTNTTSPNGKWIDAAGIVH